MKLLEILDIDISDVKSSGYDLFIVASGNEDRATWVSKELKSTQIRKVLVLGFREGFDNERRVANDLEFRRIFNTDPLESSTDDDEQIIEAVTGCLSQLKAGDVLSVLVDYSCMCRTWYGALIAMMRHVQVGRVVIDFVYSVGVYDKVFEDGVISRIASVNGFEGASYEGKGSVSVIGLGFHANASLCVLDQLESDVIVPVIADPAEVNEYVDEVLKRNVDLIHDPKSLPLLRLPCMSVQVTFEYLIETLSPFFGSKQLTLVPMGPKTHSLAFLLVAFRYPEISCLRVSLRHSNHRNVTPYGLSAASRVIFEADDHTAESEEEYCSP